MGLRQLLTALLDEARGIHREIKGLRRDLKKRHEAHEAERKEGEIIPLPYERKRLG